MTDYKIINMELIENEMQKFKINEITLIKYINQYMKYRTSLKKAKSKYLKSKSGVLKSRQASKRHYWTKKIKKYHKIYNPDLSLIKTECIEKSNIQQ